MISTGVCRWLFLVISLSTWKILLCSKEMRVVCYYTNWSVYRPGAAKFSPQNINPYMCTHLIYAFGGFTKENTLKPFDKYQDIEKGGYAKFTGLKTYNKNLKTMLAIGGWNEGSSRFSPMVANPERRREFVKNAIKFLRLNHFDGLDLDWEYPSFRDGGKSRDRDNYAQLVQDLREEFDRESSKTGRTRLLLTMAVPAGIQYINKGYDVPKLTKYLDWMNILSYDYHSAFEPAVNHHAPLYSLEEDSEYNYDGDLNIDHTIKHYLELGAEPNKLVLGIPTYGRSYTLFNPDAYEIGSPADGPGEMGEATRENGYLAYYEICDYVKNQDWEVEQPNSKAMGPYAFKEDQWVGYDDEDIVRRKAEYVAAENLGGIMFWAIDNDDFRGDCHGKAYPLIEAGREALLKAYGLTDDNQIVPPSKPQKSRRKRPNKTTNKVSPSEEIHVKNEKGTPISRRRNRIKQVEKEESINETKPKRKLRRKNSRISDDEEPISYSSLKVVTPSYTTPSPPSTPDMGGAFKCEDEGFFQHPKDCKKYFWCLSGAGDSGIVAHAFTCPAGLYFNKAADSCDYSQNVICNKKMQKANTASTKEETTSTASFVSTTRTPPKITAATSRTTFKQTTTTTEAPEDEYDYEDDEDGDENTKSDTEEEDPRVIKELIDLIRKAGGIEELEKQLRIPNENSSSQSIKFTTQSPISQSLYEKVINKAIKNTTGRRKLYSQNSRGPQSDGSTAEKENSSTQPKTSRGKLSYTSISRSRPIISESTEDEDDNESENSEKTRKPPGRTNSVEYVNIRRPKISTTTSEPDNDSLLSRNKFLGETEDEENESEFEDEEDDEDTDINVPKKQTFIPHYTNIRRQKPTTKEVTSSSMFSDIRITSTESPVETKEESELSTTSKYKQFLRRTISTTSTTTDPPSSTIDETHSYSSKSTPVNSPQSGNVEASSKRYIQLRRGTTTERSSNETDKAIGSTQTTVSTEFPSENRSDSSYINNVLETTGIHSPKDNNIITETETNKISVGDNIDSTTMPTTILSGETLTNMKIPQDFDSKSTSSPVTESATQTSKVSQPNFRYRYRSKIENPQYSENSPSSQNIARTTSRFRPETQGSKKINDRTPVPQRRRLISTTEKYVEEIRSYRPTELADLSSLTAVDFSKIKEFHLVQSPNRRRRPVSSSFDTANYEEPTDSQKNNSRPPKSSERSSLNKSRRLVKGNGNQTQSVSESNKKYRRITFGTTEEPTANKNISKNNESSTHPRNRKIIRRYRPSTRSPVDSNEDNERTLNENIISSRQNLSVPANNQQQASSLNENNIENENDSFEDSNIDDDDDENIKLSESNIRENSAINSFGSDPKFERTTFRRGNLQKSSEPAKSITTEKYVSDIEINRTNEPGARTRRRKIIRKIIPTSAPSNYIHEEVANRKRKIIRKLLPVSRFDKQPESQIYDENNEGNKDNNTPKSTTITAFEDELTTRSSHIQHIQAESNSSVEDLHEDADPAELSEPESDNPEENTEYNEITTTERVTPKYVNKLFKLRQNDTRRRFKNVEVSSTTEKTFSSTPRYKGYSRRPSYSKRKSISTEKITTEGDEELHIQNEINEPTRGYIRESFVESAPTTLTYDYVTERLNLMKNSIINDNSSSDNPTTETTTNAITEIVSTESTNENITTEPPTIAFDSSYHTEVPTTESATILSTTISDGEINTNTIDTTKYDEIIQDDLSATSYSPMKTHITTDNIITIQTDESTDFTSGNIITTDGITDDSSLSTEISTSDGISSTPSAESISHRASTLRSINLRPKYIPSKLKELSLTNPTESAIILKPTRFHGRTRTQFKSFTESPKVSEDRVVSEIDSTTERAKNKIGKFKNGFRSSLQANRNQLSSTSTDRPKNTNSYKYSTTKKVEHKVEDTIEEHKVVNDKGESAINRFANKYTSSTPTQERSITEESLKKIDTDAVRNRNRNLFNRKRVMNIPVSVAKIAENSTKDEEDSSHYTTVASSTVSSSSETTILPTTELLQSSEQQTTTEFSTTLHHIFAQIIGETESSTQSIAAKEDLADKQERLIEVSRIVNVNTKEEKVKHNHVEQTTDEISSILDRIGAISRVTSIKVVDVDGMTKHDRENSNPLSPVFVHSNASDDVTTPDSPIKSSVDMIIQIAKVQEVPPPNSQQKVNLTNINVQINTSGISDQLFYNRESRKIDIYGKSKISDSKTNDIHFQKADIIDGRSHINIVTPRSIYNAEASTISLEGLFQADESPLFDRNSALNDEVLESENSKFVNVRVLHPDQSVKLNEELKETDKVIPIKILKQDEDDIATKAKVVEISPKTLNTIKIVPIRVEMSRLIANNLPLIGSSRTKSIPT